MSNEKEILRRLRLIESKVIYMDSGCNDDGDKLAQDVGEDIRKLIFHIETLTNKEEE